MERKQIFDAGSRNFEQMVYRLTQTLLLTCTIVLTPVCSTPLQSYYYVIIVICLIVVNKNLISELNALDPRIPKQKPSINLCTITVILSSNIQLL